MLKRHAPRPAGSTEPAEEVAEDRDFLRRWSRRKTQAGDAAPVPVEPTEARRDTPPAEPVQSEVDAQAVPEEPVLTDADMPSLETLGEGDDYSPFLSPGVSDKLRKLALRQLFHSSVFNIRDGLDDYDEDFRNFEALGDIITADMRHQAEVDAERAAERAKEAARAELEQADAELEQADAGVDETGVGDDSASAERESIGEVTDAGDQSTAGDPRPEPSPDDAPVAAAEDDDDDSPNNGPPAA